MIKFIFGGFTVDLILTTMSHFDLTRHNWDDFAGVGGALIGFVLFGLIVFADQYEVTKREGSK